MSKNTDEMRPSDIGKEIEKVKKAFQKAESPDTTSEGKPKIIQEGLSQLWKLAETIISTSGPFMIDAFNAVIHKEKLPRPGPHTPSAVFYANDGLLVKKNIDEILKLLKKYQPSDKMDLQARATSDPTRNLLQNMSTIIGAIHKQFPILSPYYGIEPSKLTSLASNKGSDKAKAGAKKKPKAGHSKGKHKPGHS